MTASVLDGSERRPAYYVGTRRTVFPAPESMSGSANLTLFRHSVHGLCHGPRTRRAAQRSKAIQLLKDAGEPQRYISELLDLCIHKGGPDGLDVAIDVLSQVPDLLSKYIFSFVKQDAKNWKQIPLKSRASDDVWYVLARAIAQSGFEPDFLKLPIILLGQRGTWSMRDGTLRALADLGGPIARKTVEAATMDDDAFVQATARELLESWEN